MSKTTFFVELLAVLNLLLVASGLLLVYFDWSAARRREFLYLYFAEERLGQNYWVAARHRRAQYTRLLVGFSVMLIHEFLTAILFTMVSRPADWQRWAAWWASGQDARTLLPAELWFPAQLQLWSQLFGILGLGLLIFGFLYEPHHSKASLINWVVGAYAVWWAAFALVVACGVLGDATADAVRVTSVGVRLILVCGVVYMLLRRHDREVEPGLLAVNGALLALAFVVWGVGAIGSNLLGLPMGLPLGHMFAYLVMVPTIARGVLADYEMIESSRHRLGRERQVIFTFLERIGVAFTQALQVDQVLDIILDSALETTEASAGAIYFYHEETGLLGPPIVRHFFPPLHVDTPAALSPDRTEKLEEEMKHQSFRLGEGVIGEVAETGKSRLIEDVKAEGVMLGTTTDFMRDRSMLVVPLRIREKPLGVIAVLNKQRGSFGKDDEHLLQALADQGSLSVNNAILTLEVRHQERLGRDLQVARDIQQRLLPRECPELPGFEIGRRYSSATEVGGDYYDFFMVDEQRLGIVVADVSGKGVQAALIAAMIRSAFRAQARGNPDVRDVLTRVNEFISHDLPGHMFITCVYGILEIPTRRFSWARAGHEPLIVAHESAPIDVLSPDGFALGVIDSAEFSQMLEVDTVQMRSGDRILIFTDGLTEAMNAKGEEFGMQRILQVMNHLDGQLGAVAPAASTNGHGGVVAVADAARNGSATAVAEFGGLGSTPGGDGSKSRRVAAAPDSSPEDPEDLKSMERAVQSHVAGADQSDDLTIVYLAAK